MNHMQIGQTADGQCK